ncbi:conserved hypothetical protein [Cupriavidus taiwanensis]|uniref:Cupin 2 conserved barrel domain-containing protein n=1 Tax=Cupriavidus taiwanensis TaxID=164546 RepID=A0A975XGK5_9BURK|nr:alpha/beta fold hydrolase [Cupriavidus taiwanensis]SOY68865.1 conserved hypothetical protein [Cupriavidus taiwanensis]
MPYEVAEFVFEVSDVDACTDLRLRRMVVRPPAPKGAVLFQHGFPEIMFAWKEIARTLGREYEVHAFDWPGFGNSSRPPVERFAYSPRDYATVLTRYVDTAGIGGSRLVIYATDIDALPALLAAVNRPAGIQRTDLVKHDLSTVHVEGVQVRVDFEPGALAPKHVHPGEEIAYVLEGTLEYQLGDNPPVALKAGQALFIPAGVAHSARNAGSGKSSELATYIAKKGAPLVTPSN